MVTTSRGSYSKQRASHSKKLQKLESKAARRMVERSKDEVLQYRRSPHRYAEEVLRVDWWSAQQEIAQALHEHNRVLVLSSYGIGKTHVAGGLVNWWYDSFPNSLVVTTAPTDTLVKAVLWREIRAQRKTLPAADITQIKDPDNPLHYAFGMSPGERINRDQFGTQAFRGLHGEFELLVFDDAAGVPTARWIAGESLVVGAQNKWLAIGNPVVTSGPYWDAAHSEKWHVIQISSLDHPNIIAGLAGEPEPYPGAVSLGWIEDKLDDPYWCEYLGTPQDTEEQDLWINDGAFEFPPSENVWYAPTPTAETNMLGRFPSQATNAVWSMAWLEAAKIRELAWIESDPLELGVDVGRYGDDASAVHARRGPVSLLHRTWRKTAVPDTVGRVIAATDHALDLFTSEDLPPKIFIRVDTGYAPGVYDGLEEHYAQYQAVTVVGVNAQGVPDDRQHFENNRSELWITTANRGKAGMLDMTRLDPATIERLSSQLAAPIYRYDSKSRMIVESKDDIKARIGRSPDDADVVSGQEGAHWSDCPVGDSI
ncbi:hypothetical protein LCGC14_2367940, partial [marine sediment metagenome]